MGDLHVATPADAPRFVGDPWSRQPGETSKAFRAFAVYRDLGPDRTFPAVLEALRKPAGYTRQLSTWSAAWRWVLRAELWDDHTDELRRRAAGVAIEEMSARHVTEALEMQRIALMPALELVRRRDAGELDLSTMSVDGLFRIARLATYSYAAAAKLERLARGVSENGAAEDGDGPSWEEERARIAELHGEAVVQVIVLVLGSTELGIPPEKQEIARRLAGQHLRELAREAG